MKSEAYAGWLGSSCDPNEFTPNSNYVNEGINAITIYENITKFGYTNNYVITNYINT